MRQLVVSNRAIADIEKSKNWYNKQQEKLGDKFTNYVFKCFADINNHPLGYPAKYASTREMVVKKYPFVIIYTVEEKVVFILRVFPCKANPKNKYQPNSF